MRSCTLPVLCREPGMRSPCGKQPSQLVLRCGVQRPLRRLRRRQNHASSRRHLHQDDYARCSGSLYLLLWKQRPVLRSRQQNCQVQDPHCHAIIILSHNTSIHSTGIFYFGSYTVIIPAFPAKNKLKYVFCGFYRRLNVDL